MYSTCFLYFFCLSNFGDREDESKKINVSQCDLLYEENQQLHNDLRMFEKLFHAKNNKKNTQTQNANVTNVFNKYHRIINSAIQSLLSYYDNDTKLLDSAPHYKNEDEVLTSRMALSMLGRRGKEFVIGIQGSSVTAGHDTFFEAAWPSVMGRVLKPIWKVFGIRFVFLNQAVGGRNPMPWPFCYRQMFGDRPDIVMHEAEYWPFEAGLHTNVAREGASKNTAAFELLFRNVIKLKKKPSLHILKMGGRLEWVDSLFSKQLKEYKHFSFNAFGSFDVPFQHLNKKLHRYQKPDYSKWPLMKPLENCTKQDYKRCVFLKPDGVKKSIYIYFKSIFY